MSYCHIKLNKTFNNDNTVRYSIYSMDFNNKHLWEEFGIIEIDKKTGKFVHTSKDNWEKNKIYPIELLDLPKEKRELDVKTRYQDYGSGSWALKIFNYIRKCVESGDYPENVDLVS